MKNKQLNAEIICVGTELLLGQITNTNAVFLGRELANLGVNCLWQTVVGDNQRRVELAVLNALERADIVLTTGGLGPTPDDLTHESIASALNTDLVFDEEVLEIIKSRFAAINKVMVNSNRKQAFRPQGAQTLPNSLGTAPGIIWDVSTSYGAITNLKISHKQVPKQNSKYILTFPGVPRELYSMWEETAKPFIQSLATTSEEIIYKELKFFGIGESDLAEQVSELLNLDDPTIAPLAGRGECRLRIASKGIKNKALNKINKVEQKIKEKVGEYIYGEDTDTLEIVVARELQKRGQTVSLAESCTGGLISKLLTDVPGSSAYTKFNLVTYSNESKTKMLQVSDTSLIKHGAVSEVVAREMAHGILNLSQSDWGVSVSGVAGPDGGTTEKPIGTVFIGIASKGGYENVIKLNLGNRSRKDIRWMTALNALNKLRQAIQETENEIL